MKNWKSLVKSVAPLIGTALGGPAAGMAVKALSNSLLGHENGTEAQLEEFVNQASPEQLLKLKQSDKDFEVKMAVLGLDIYKAEAVDRSDARVNNKDHFMPTALCIMLTIAVSSILIALMLVEVPPANKDLVAMVTGQIVTAWMASVAYWVGTTKGSANKSKAYGETR